jgi:proton-translocating NADH-quinone oxidoreductase chain M
MIPIFLLMLIVPAVALAIIPFTKRSSKKVIIGSSFLGVLSALYMLYSYLSGNVLVPESYNYISALGIKFGLSSTPISAIFILLSSIVIFAASLSIGIDSRHKRLASELMALFQLAATGIFLSSNLFMFFIFWDVGVIAMFFMIYLLGSSGRRRAAMRFLMYEIFASTMLFLAIILLFSFLGTADIPTIMQLASGLSPTHQLEVFVPFLLAFMVNMPIFPFHAWLPDAHTEASTEGSMVLSGVLTKFGGFGMLLVFAILPITGLYAPYVAALAVISAIYSAFALMRQTDMKRIVAYSTVVEMGVIMVAISSSTALGTAGAVVAMLAHALTVSFMFLVVAMLHKTFGERDVRLLKGSVIEAPGLSYAFVFGVLAMVGLPLTIGFAGDLLLFMGAFSAFGILGLLPLAAIALMGASLYLVLQKSILGAREHSTAIDIAGVLPMAAGVVLASFILLFGFLPHLITSIL